MTHFDVFNGDADGLCALQQLRLSNPIKSTLVTGLKRDIALVKTVDCQPHDEMTVLDISFDKNRDAIVDYLEKNVTISYFDHHYCGDIPQNSGLTSHINLDANICTSLIVNNYLKNEQALWAVVGAYGDNLDESAITLADQFNCDETTKAQLKQLGICLNYNGYGFELDDLIFHPKELYLKLSPYKNPLDFINNDDAYKILSEQYFADLDKASQINSSHSSDHADVIFLPNESWSKRVIGVFGNDLARKNPDKGFAILIPYDDDSETNYRVSLRAPLNNKTGADEVCRQFETGGGRKAAAGIHALPQKELDRFISVFTEFYNFK